MPSANPGVGTIVKSDITGDRRLHGRTIGDRQTRQIPSWRHPHDVAFSEGMPIRFGGELLRVADPQPATGRSSMINYTLLFVLGGCLLGAIQLVAGIAIGCGFAAPTRPTPAAAGRT